MVTLSLRPAARVLLCAASFLTAVQGTSACAAPVEPVVEKQVLQKIDYPGNGHYTEIVLTEMPPGYRAARHMHPGIESGYIISGGGMLSIAGQPDRRLEPGESAVVPPNTVHSFVNGPLRTRIVSTYVLEAGKRAKTEAR